MTIICFFGASITHGCWDPGHGGWVGRIKECLDKKSVTDLQNFILTYNLGVSGDISRWLLDRLEVECEARMYEDTKEKNVLVFSIGINDSMQGPLHVPLEQFKENLQKILQTSKKFTSRIAFVGLTPVNPSPLKWSEKESYNNEDIKKYDEAMQDFCKKNNLLFVELFDVWIKEDYKNWLIDGLHPNTEGHKKIFEVVKEALEKNEFISF
ncbi:hypothetical protein KY310_03905 [Candidatus Woesearchaeota archaeon]|nr:hypothetical protein [Candidatus Woesearchaeota archaeon]